MVSDRIYAWIYRSFALVSLIVFVSGVWLIFRYRPTAAQAWADIYDIEMSHTIGTTIREVHRWAAHVWLCALIPLVLIELTRRAPRGALRVVATFVLSAAASFTGYLLPYQQIALNAVTVGTNMRGYPSLLWNDDVKFFLLGGVEVAPSTLATWFVLHIGVGAIALLVGRSSQTKPPPPPGAEQI